MIEDTWYRPSDEDEAVYSYDFAVGEDEWDALVAEWSVAVTRWAARDREEGPF